MEIGDRPMHHRIKTTGCWKVTQHSDGTYEWTSKITGRTYTSPTHAAPPAAGRHQQTDPVSTELSACDALFTGVVTLVLRVDSTAPVG